jgi:hypothetical protein
MWIAREGVHTDKLIPVLTSSYSIPERLKEIDSKYFVMFNKRTQKFEIHHAGQPFSSYCLTVPYEELDCRTVDLVLETRRENMKKLIAEIEAENLKREIDAENKHMNELDWKAREYYQYLDNHPSADARLPKNAYKERFV